MFEMLVLKNTSAPEQKAAHGGNRMSRRGRMSALALPLGKMHRRLAIKSCMPLARTKSGKAHHPSEEIARDAA